MLLQSSQKGCSAGGGVDASFSKAGGIVGAVAINGQCYRDFQEENGGQFVIVGYVCMGQCINPWWAFSGCTVGNCNKGTAGSRCNEYVPGCEGRCEGRQI